MNKKKIITLLVAGILTVGIVGGTFAWFTSNDSVTNKFSTASTKEPTNPDAGIEIEEEIKDEDGDGKYDDDVFPGMTMDKEVTVNSTANYEQFLRVKITKVWKVGDKEVKYYKEKDDGRIEYYSESEYEDGAKELDYGKIKLNLNNVSDSKGNTWTDIKSDGYYYYNQILEPEATTEALLKSVTFVQGENDNYYKGLNFEVIVQAEGIQTTGVTNETESWECLPQYVYQ